MNRRHHMHWWNRLTIGTLEVAGVVWANFVYVVTLPFYSLVGFWQGLGQKKPRGAPARGPVGEFIDTLIAVPQWTWYYITLLAVMMWHAVLAWPRVMRLRDLAAGLPALGAAVGAFVVLFVINKNDLEVVNDYDRARREAIEQHNLAQDEAGRKKALEDLLFYNRALSKIQPDNEFYRIETAQVYGMMPDVKQQLRGRSILNSLAAEGSGEAMLMLAKLQMQTLHSDVDFIRAENLLVTAEKAFANPRPDLNYLFGNLYRQWFLARYERTGSAVQRFRAKAGVSDNHARPSADAMLANAAKYLLQADQSDPQTILALGEIHMYRGEDLLAGKAYTDLAAILTARLAVKEDTEVRLMLAQIYRALLKFHELDEVLRQGTNLTGDPRYADQRCSMFLLQLSMIRRDGTVRDYEREQRMLRNAYLAQSVDPFMIYEYFLALCSASEQEQGFARVALQSIVAEKRDSATALFLLYFDAVRRKSAVEASKLAAQLRPAPDPRIATSVGLVANLARDRQVPANAPRAPVEFFQTALLVWPEHPDLLFLEGNWQFEERRYAAAVQTLLKALERLQNKGTLQVGIAEEWRVHYALADAYLKNGRRDKQEEHFQLGKAAQKTSGAAQQKL